MSRFGGPVLPLVLAMTAITLWVTTTLSSYNVFIFNTFLLAAMGAIALNLLMGTAGQVSLGNSAFLAIGAFVTILLSRAGVALPFDVLGGAIVAGAIGFVIALPALRLRGIYLALATLAGHFIVLYVAERYQSAAVGEAGFILEPTFGASLGERYVTWSWVLLGVVVAMLLISATLVRARSGRAWRIIRDHEIIAGTLGISASRLKLQAFLISSVMIGIEGGLMAHFLGSITTQNFTLAIAIGYVAMIFIGGLDTVWGSVIGAAIVVLLPFLIPSLVDVTGSSSLAAHAPQASQIVYGVLVVLFVTASPGGIVGILRQLRARLVRRVSGSRRGATGSFQT